MEMLHLFSEAQKDRGVTIESSLTAYPLASDIYLVLHLLHPSISQILLMTSQDLPELR